MIWAVLLTILPAPTITPLEQFVNEFHSLNGEIEELAFLQIHTIKTNTSYLAYLYSLQMKRAEYTYNVIEKLRIYRTYSSKLDSLILAKPENPHARYVRLVIQENLPRMLKDSDKISEDLKFLNRFLRSTDGPEYLTGFIRANTRL